MLRHSFILILCLTSSVEAQHSTALSNGYTTHTGPSLPIKVTRGPVGINGDLREFLDTRAEIEQQPLHLENVDPGWWKDLIGQPLLQTTYPVSLSLNDTLSRALQYSKQIRVFAELPMIRETAIVEADAAFDWNAFADSQWKDTSDPVGNSLTAGPGIERFKDHQLNFSAGLRRRTDSGGQLELAQQFGIQENNSQFFTPNNQGSSRFVLNFTQPLLRGKGEVYNRSLICLASIDKQIADEEFRRQLQSHLLEVTRAYWAIYLERGVMLQKMNSYSRSRKTVAKLETRGQIDATRSQLMTARAALKTRRAQLGRAINAVRNAEGRLRSLVNDPSMADPVQTEIIPLDGPILNGPRSNRETALADALMYRPEIHQAVKQIKAAAIRRNMSINELKPVLNLVTEAYVAGLDGQRDLGGAYSNQFSEGEPGYSIGLQFEVPIGNRAARARNCRRRLELRQMENQYATTLETVGLEVEVAARELETSRRELYAKSEAMLAQQEQVQYLQARWTQLPGVDVSAALTLQNLLNAQEELTIAEQEFLQSQLTHSLGITNLQKATGKLLMDEGVSINRFLQCGLPTHSVQKSQPIRLSAPVLQSGRVMSNARQGVVTTGKAAPQKPALMW